MRRGQRASSSSGSEGSHQPWSKDSAQSTPCGSSSDEDEDSVSLSDVEVESAMKRSRGFSCSFSFEDEQQLQSLSESREELSSENARGEAVSEAVETDVQFMRIEKKDALCDTSQPRSGLFRPQALWLAVTRCLSLRWPPCLSINRQSTRKLAYQVDLDQSEDTRSSVSSESTNTSSSSTSTADDQEVSLVNREEEETKKRGVKSVPPVRRWVSCSSPRLPRSRQATDSVLASMILEKEMYLRVELVDSGEEKEDLRYRAEWKLSERTKELAEGVWLSRSQKMMD